MGGKDGGAVSHAIPVAPPGASVAWAANRVRTPRFVLGQRIKRWQDMAAASWRQRPDSDWRLVQRTTPENLRGGSNRSARSGNGGEEFLL